jgi:hypothetical protein
LTFYPTAIPGGGLPEGFQARQGASSGSRRGAARHSLEAEVVSKILSKMAVSKTISSDSKDLNMSMLVVSS